MEGIEARIDRKGSICQCFLTGRDGRREARLIKVAERVKGIRREGGNNSRSNRKGSI